MDKEWFTMDTQDGDILSLRHVYICQELLKYQGISLEYVGNDLLLIWDLIKFNITLFPLIRELIWEQRKW